ncbi:hypothetical protein DUI87_16556 [Hirundo rustica rustica]|uniref:Uncharacterized protein n=1 Tax=Hirundo rustica rustica TaxID=333673 RepID=A0A3M0K7S6_HIRRU|nr:hypothetical protein DUI87_16556 [Hirundo rustica rustica]
MQIISESSLAEYEDSQEQGPSLQPPSPGPPTEGKQQAQLFWDGLAKEARSAAIESESERAWKRPPPYAPQNGAEPQRDGRDADAAGGNREGPLDNAYACEQEKGGKPGGGIKANQSACLKTYPYKARASRSRRRGEPRGKERPNPKRKGWGRSPTKRLRSPEVSSQSTSGSESDSIWDEWLDKWSVADSDSDSNKEEVRVHKISNHNASAWVKGKLEKERTPLTDWRKIKIACADWAPSATLAFPVRVGGQGGNERTYQ